MCFGLRKRNSREFILNHLPEITLAKLFASLMVTVSDSNVPIMKGESITVAELTLPPGDIFNNQYTWFLEREAD